MPALATQERPAKTSPPGWNVLRILPGLALCLAVTGVALAMERGEAAPHLTAGERPISLLLIRALAIG